jgi:tRNA C32,U32 (ribose-2'-O)-methylase TrmJ
MTNDDIDFLMQQSQESIDKAVQKKELEIYVNGLQETLNEINVLKNALDKFIPIRNDFIRGLYNRHSYSAMKLSDMTGLSRQMVHNLVKEEVNDG